MIYDFDTQVDRRQTGSFKWHKYSDRDVLPMWVADMDFPCATEILSALHDRIDHGVLGYSLPQDSLYETVIERMQKLYGWEIHKQWIVWIPGIVPALNVCCRMLDGDGGVLTTTPIYPPFLHAPGLSGRQLLKSELVRRGMHWELDFDHLEPQLEKADLFLFCTPHNPAGRVWSRAELEKVAELCLKHDVLLCSDDIHCELVLDEDKPHLPIAMLGDDIASSSMTFMAPSKTFNIPGLNSAFAIIPNRKLRMRFMRGLEGIMPHVNTLGYVAMEAAFRHGDDWLAQVIEYLRDNRDLVERRIAEMPGLTTTHVEATYLSWIDARDLSVSDPAKLFEDGGVALSDGAHFDMPGFVRLNFACPRPMLKEALMRMERALNS